MHTLPVMETAGGGGGVPTPEHKHFPRTSYLLALEGENVLNLLEAQIILYCCTCNFFFQLMTTALFSILLLLPQYSK
jgi:hypothetical protein